MCRRWEWYGNFYNKSEHNFYHFCNDLHRIWENTGFHRPVFYHKRTESSILFLYGRIQISENPCFHIFYAVWFGTVGCQPQYHWEERIHFLSSKHGTDKNQSPRISRDFYNECEHHLGLLRCNRVSSLVIGKLLQSTCTIKIINLIKFRKLKNWNWHWKINIVEKVCCENNWIKMKRKFYVFILRSFTFTLILIWKKHTIK